jgi:hypothetical protein
MIRFLIDQFRQAPGPLKQARLIAADLAEEVVDLAEHYLKGKSGFAETVDAEPDAPSAGSSGKTAVAEPPATKTAKTAAVKPKPVTETIDVDARLGEAIETPGNKRKQEFKVLAILWDARSRETGPLSAKAISQHGEKIDLKIRHENVRKVIRTRLEKYIRVHTEGMGNGTIYRYEIDKPGIEYFEQTYFKSKSGS